MLKGTVSVWACVVLCAISFLVGRNTSSVPALAIPPAAPTTTLSSPPCPICNDDANNNTKRGVNNATIKNSDCPEVVVVAPPPPPPPSAAEENQGVVFDDAWIADPNRVMQTINSMCKLIMDRDPGASRKIGVGTVMLCYAHVLTYKRDYDYGFDSIEGANRKDYYVGIDLPPYQMDMMQYLAVLSTIASVPSRQIKDQMESRGRAFRDANRYYYQREAPKRQGPRVLFWGCGSDTPLHAHVVEFLGGTITFIDNSPGYVKICKQWHPDIRLVEPTGNMTSHTLLVEKSVPPDGSGLETDDVNDPLTASQWMPDLDGIEREEPWDVIVVDGPARELGRSQPLYMAKRLAQSYGSNHQTHIFLHDASRGENCVIANAIMGHDPSVYVGNTLPRKGLKHWRVMGRNRTLPPTLTNGTKHDGA